LDPRDLRRQDEVARGDAGAAVGDERLLAEALTELSGRQEAALLDQLCEGHVLGARDVPRDRIDRLALAAEALGRASIEQAQAAQLLRCDRVVRVRARSEVAALPAASRFARAAARFARAAARFARLQRAARLAPRAHPAIE